MLKKCNARWSASILFGFSFIILFFNFQTNIFNVVDAHWYESFQKDSESLVIGRLVKSRSDGVLSEQGRLGRYKGLPGSKESVQTSLYHGEIEGGTYLSYNSQFGIQGVFFSMLDQAFNSLNIIDIKHRIDVYHGIASGFIAVILSLIILLFYFEVGISASILLLLSISLSQWMAVMARNLYWVLGLMYLPFLVVFVAHKYEEVKGAINIQLLYFLVYIVMMIKSLSGYEYISTIIIAMVSPIVYFSIKNHWGYLLATKRIFFTAVFGVFGFLTALLVHIWQLQLSTNSIMKAWSVIFERILVRTHAASSSYSGTPYEKSLSSSIYEVFHKYINGAALELKNVFGPEYFLTVTFEGLIWLYLIATILVFTSFKYIRKYYSQLLALSIATWFSFLAPLSWFFLAKGHSFIHVHINYILWHLPFTIFGFALLFFVCVLLIKNLYEYSKYASLLLSGVIILFISSSVAYNVLNLEDNVEKANTVMAYDHSDNNWKNGISRTRAAFFISNTAQNRYTIKDCEMLKFSFSGERAITEIKMSKEYINIYVSGSKLNLEKDGYPNIIKITTGVEK